MQHIQRSFSSLFLRLQPSYSERSVPVSVERVKLSPLRAQFAFAPHAGCNSLVVKVQLHIGASYEFDPIPTHKSSNTTQLRLC